MHRGKACDCHAAVSVMVTVCRLFMQSKLWNPRQGRVAVESQAVDNTPMTTIGYGGVFLVLRWSISVARPVICSVPYITMTLVIMGHAVTTIGKQGSHQQQHRNPGKSHGVDNDDRDRRKLRQHTPLSAEMVGSMPCGQQRPLHGWDNGNSAMSS